MVDENPKTPNTPKNPKTPNTPDTLENSDTLKNPDRRKFLKLGVAGAVAYRVGFAGKVLGVVFGKSSEPEAYASESYRLGKNGAVSVVLLNKGKPGGACKVRVQYKYIKRSRRSRRSRRRSAGKKVSVNKTISLTKPEIQIIKKRGDDALYLLDKKGFHSVARYAEDPEKMVQRILNDEAKAIAARTEAELNELDERLKRANDQIKKSQRNIAEAKAKRKQAKEERKQAEEERKQAEKEMANATQELLTGASNEINSQ